jgi:hypothetical protein
MLMMASGCFISPYLKAIVAACDRSQLSNPKARPGLLVIKQPHKRLVNMEISELASQLTELHALRGADAIAVFVSAKYANRLLSNTRVSRYLMKNWPQCVINLETTITSVGSHRCQIG